MLKTKQRSKGELITWIREEDGDENEDLRKAEFKERNFKQKGWNERVQPYTVFEVNKDEKQQMERCVLFGQLSCWIYSALSHGSTFGSANHG